MKPLVEFKLFFFVSKSYSVVIDCTQLTQERPEVVRIKIRDSFAEAAWFAPSILVFESLDHLLPGEGENRDSSRATQLSRFFCEVASETLRSHKIALVATALLAEALHPSLTRYHVFGEKVKILPPDRTERTAILQSLLRATPEIAVDSSLELASISTQTEGFIGADLKTLTERAILGGAIRGLNADGNMNAPHRVAITQGDFEDALKGFTPSSLKGIKLQSSATSWTDIGGLEETRRMLLETLEWPTKYAPIFATCPLRLRSGILLYGPPGCGKTMLASAIAKECGLNFISVKGFT